MTTDGAISPTRRLQQSEYQMQQQKHRKSQGMQTVGYNT